MTSELRLVRREPDLQDRTNHPKEARIRNLGSAIFLAAIRDYRSLDEDTHRDAEQFLYPQRAPARTNMTGLLG